MINFQPKIPQQKILWNKNKNKQNIQMDEDAWVKGWGAGAVLFTYFRGRVTGRVIQIKKINKLKTLNVECLP
jgi:hypothetical protein